MMQLKLLLTSMEEAPDAVDAGVVDYINSMLEDGDGESQREQVTELLCACSPAFNSLDPAAAQRMVAGLFATAAAAREELQCAPLTTPDPAQRPVTAAGTGRATTSAAAREDTTAATRGSVVTASGDVPESRVTPEAAQLVALCPDGALHADFATHLLRKQGCVQGAAEWLLECPDWAQAQERWQDAHRVQPQGPEMPDNCVQDKIKHDIVTRFALQPVHDPKPDVKPARKKPVTAWAPAKSASQSSNSRVRFVDGRPVVTDGKSKYILEKVGEEWDGGSKGRVYTKGKRGKGFV